LSVFQIQLYNSWCLPFRPLYDGLTGAIITIITDVLLTIFGLTAPFSGLSHIYCAITVRPYQLAVYFLDGNMFYPHK
jgi:hypothetical protein